MLLDKTGTAKESVVLSGGLHIAFQVNKSKMNDEREIDKLILTLGEKHWPANEEAMDALVEIGVPAIPRLLAVLLDEDSGINIMAGITLGRMKRTEIVPDLIEACNHESYRVRQAAITALGKMGDRRALPTLIRALEDSDAWVSACDALGEFKEPSVMLALAATLRKWDAGNPAYVLGSFGEVALPFLFEALRDRDVHWLSAEGIEEAIVSIGQPAIPGLLEILTDKNTPRFATYKDRVATILGRIGDPVAIPALKQSLLNDYLESAAWALAVIGVPSAIDILCKALQHQEVEVRIYAIDAVGTSKEKAVVDELITLLSDEERYAGELRVCDFAAEALEKIQTTKSINAVREWRSHVEGNDFEKDSLIGKTHLKSHIFMKADLKGINFEQADLRGAVFQGSNLDEGNLKSARLEGADMRGASLVRTNLQEANLAGVNFSKADLTNADLSKANLMGAALVKAKLRNANLAEAKLGGAILRNTDFENANLLGAYLGGADLIGVNFKGANLLGVDLGGARLHDITYDKDTIWPDDFDPDKRL